MKHIPISVHVPDSNCLHSVCFHSKRQPEQQTQGCSAVQAVRCAGSEGLTGAFGLIQLSCQLQPGTTVCSHLCFVPLPAVCQTEEIVEERWTGALTVSSWEAKFTASTWGVKPSLHQALRSSAVLGIAETPFKLYGHGLDSVRVKTDARQMIKQKRSIFCSDNL